MANAMQGSSLPRLNRRAATRIELRCEIPFVPVSIHHLCANITP